MDNIFSARIDALREHMVRNGWDAVVVSGSDPHASEYPAPRWKQVEWLTGFTGEAGDVVITRDHSFFCFGYNSVINYELNSLVEKKIFLKVFSRNCSLNLINFH